MDSAVRIGLHASIAGSFAKAAETAHSLGADTLQIFSSSPRMWRASMPSPSDVHAFARARKQHGLHPLVIHDNYLINLAAADTAVRERSIAAFRGELQRAAALTADYVVAHPGSWRDQSIESAIACFAVSLERATANLDTGRVTLLLECTAGQGHSLGYRLEELAELAHAARRRTQLPIGFCLDTCHLYAAGYDIATNEGLDLVLEHADAILGLQHIPVIHANDSQTAIGSRRDRHANIGDGTIGAEAFGRMLRHPKLAGKAFIIETPEDDDGHARDIRTLRRLSEG